MKWWNFSLFLAAVGMSATANAEEITKGYLEQATSSRLIVEVKGAARKHFTPATDIKVLSESGLLAVTDIPKHSIVQVVERNGLAELVIVEEMPR